MLVPKLLLGNEIVFQALLDNAPDIIFDLNFCQAELGKKAGSQAGAWEPGLMRRTLKQAQSALQADRLATPKGWRARARGLVWKYCKF